MPVDQPDAWVRTYLEDVFNGHNLQSLNNFVSNWLGDRDLKGREAWRAAMANFFDAFPDAASGWRRGHAQYKRRPLRRLWSLFVEGQAGFHLRPTH